MTSCSPASATGSGSSSCCPGKDVICLEGANTQLKHHFLQKRGSKSGCRPSSSTALHGKLNSRGNRGGVKGLLRRRDLILHRSHTVAAPMHHRESGGNKWDTVKPLHIWFRDISRVLLVDDDSYKVFHRPGLLLRLNVSESMIDRMLERPVRQLACPSHWALQGQPAAPP